MTSAYIKPTVAEYIEPIKWRQKNGIEVPDEYLRILSIKQGLMYWSGAALGVLFGFIIALIAYG